MGKGVGPCHLLKFGVGVKIQITLDFKMFSSLNHESRIQYFLHGHVAVAAL